MWVAAGGGNTIAYSIDGFNWTGLGLSSLFINGCNSVAFNYLSTTKITPPSTLFTGYTLAISGQTPSFLNGTYTVSCSSFRDANWLPWKAFNGFGNTGWVSSATYSSTTGLYTGATSTTVSGSSILGEWLPPAEEEGGDLVEQTDVTVDPTPPVVEGEGEEE